MLYVQHDGVHTVQCGVTECKCPHEPLPFCIRLDATPGSSYTVVVSDQNKMSVKTSTDNPVDSGVFLILLIFYEVGGLVQLTYLCLLNTADVHTIPGLGLRINSLWNENCKCLYSFNSLIHDKLNE